MCPGPPDMTWSCMSHPKRFTHTDSTLRSLLPDKGSYAHFTDRETEAERVDSSIGGLLRHNAGMGTHAVQLKPPLNYTPGAASPLHTGALSEPAPKLRALAIHLAPDPKIWHEEWLHLFPMFRAKCGAANRTFQANGPESNLSRFPAVLLGELPASFPPRNLSFYYVTSALQLSSMAAVGIFTPQKLASTANQSPTMGRWWLTILSMPSPYFLGRMAQTQGAPNPGLSQHFKNKVSGVPRTS